MKNEEKPQWKEKKGDCKVALICSAQVKLRFAGRRCGGVAMFHWTEKGIKTVECNF